MQDLPFARSILAALAVALPASTVAAQLAWQQLSTAQSPAPRFGHSATHYWGITFGGRDATQAFNDTWSYAGSTTGWLPLPTATAPTPRHGHAMDMGLPSALMFGGADAAGVRNAETWQFTTNWFNTPPGQPFTSSWAQLSPTHAPSPRDGHALAYDHATSADVLLFGGRTDTGLSNETWLFTAGDWQLVTTSQSPPAREGHSLLPTWHGWILCGGADDNNVFDDAWMFDGQDWQQLPNMPFAAAGAAATLLGFERKRHVFVGGRDPGGAMRTEVFEQGLDGTWFAQPIVGAMPARERATVTRDYYQTPALQQAMTAVVFGGRDGQGNALGDTWRLMPTNIASSQMIGSGCGPGAWSNNGPELWLPKVILGNTDDATVFTHTPGTLVFLGVQLGTASAPQPCQIAIAPELVWFGLSSTTTAQFRQPLAIPFFEPLRGATLSLQGLALEPTAANGIALSRVGILRLGD